MNASRSGEGGQRRSRYIQNKHFCTYSICSAYSEHIQRPAAFPNTRQSLEKVQCLFHSAMSISYSIHNLHTKCPDQMYIVHTKIHSIQYTYCVFQTAFKMSTLNVHFIHYSECPSQGLNLQDLTHPSLRMQWPCNCIHLRTLLLQQEYGTGFLLYRSNFFFRNGADAFAAVEISNKSKYSKLIENCPGEPVQSNAFTFSLRYVLLQLES